MNYFFDKLPKSFYCTITFLEMKYKIKSSKKITKAIIDKIIPIVAFELFLVVSSLLRVPKIIPGILNSGPKQVIENNNDNIPRIKAIIPFVLFRFLTVIFGIFSIGIFIGFLFVLFT